MSTLFDLLYGKGQRVWKPWSDLVPEIADEQEVVSSHAQAALGKPRLQAAVSQSRARKTALGCFACIAGCQPCLVVRNSRVVETEGKHHEGMVLRRCMTDVSVKGKKEIPSLRHSRSWSLDNLSQAISDDREGIQSLTAPVLSPSKDLEINSLKAVCDDKKGMQIVTAPAVSSSKDPEIMPESANVLTCCGNPSVGKDDEGDMDLKARTDAAGDTSSSQQLASTLVIQGQHQISDHQPTAAKFMSGRSARINLQKCMTTRAGGSGRGNGCKKRQANFAGTWLASNDKWNERIITVRGMQAMAELGGIVTYGNIEGKKLIWQGAQSQTMESTVLPDGRLRDADGKIWLHKKFECQYHINSVSDEHPADQVKGRILGTGGSHVQEIKRSADEFCNEKSTKLRLRGKGSGFMEQLPDGSRGESSDPLMLCISAFTEQAFVTAREMTETHFSKFNISYYVHEGKREGGY